MAIPVITDTQKAELNERGYTIFPDVFTEDEMNSLAVRIETYQKRHEEAIAAKGGTEGLSRASEITFTDHLAEHDPEIEAFTRRPEFVAICGELLGPDVDLYWNQSVFKMPEGEKEFPWHQDDGYTPVTPSPYLTLWLSLNGATSENGTVSVLPGSHKNGLAPHKPSPLGLVCHDADDPDQGVSVEVSAGGIAAFWSTTMHKSGVNRSKGIRKAYIIQYSKAPLMSLQTGESILNGIALTRSGTPVA
ncbi:MAG: phytanoyl-CoA dioxygenase family protein [Akkermansiaceae bacterium]|nr:phytanoyl-CoA dioxygenase family protein [Armatimonadota bacterium]